MTAADDDLLLAVSEALAEAVTLGNGQVEVGDMARAAIDAVRRFDAATVVPQRRPGPASASTPGWDDTRKAALHDPERL